MYDSKPSILHDVRTCKPLNWGNILWFNQQKRRFYVNHSSNCPTLMAYLTICLFCCLTQSSIPLYRKINNFLYIQNLKANLSWVDYEDKNQTCGTSKRCGSGGFFPFDFDGVVKGAAKCKYYLDIEIFTN